MTTTGTVVYTDGACVGNPGPGGWAWAVPGGRFASGAEERTTNQRMEIAAVLEALRAIDGPVEVRSDSTYVVNCFRDRWWEGWIARGWKTSAKKPVANRDLWEPLVTLVRERGDVSFTWVKGHGDDPMNDLVDRLAVEAARTQQGRSGTGVPEDLGPPDVAGRDPRLPPGRLVLVTGHRPPELGGWDDNPVATRVRDRLAEILTAKKSLHDDLVVVTGLNLGAEQLGAEAAAPAGVPYVAVLAYPEFDSQWPDAARRRYRSLFDGAAGQIELQTKRPESRQQAGGALARRDGWLSRQVDEALVVWDGHDDRVGRTARTLEEQLGEDVWIVDPTELQG